MRGVDLTDGKSIVEITRYAAGVLASYRYVVTAGSRVSPYLPYDILGRSASSVYVGVGVLLCKLVY